MSALELVRYLSSAVFLLVALAVLARTVREPRREYVAATLFFGGLAILIVQSLVTTALGVTLPRELAIASAIVLVALPWLELRLVSLHVEVSRRVGRASLVAFIGSAAGIVALTLIPSLPQPIGVAIGLIIVAYFFLAGSYAAYALVREARAESGPSIQRVRAGAAGAFLLGLALLAALLRPLGADLADVTTRLVGLASALAFVVAFAPPRFVQRAWSEPVVRSLVRRGESIVAQGDLAAVVRGLETMATEIMGADSARVLVGRGDPTGRATDALEQAARDAIDRGRQTSADGTIFASPIEIGAAGPGAVAIHMRRRPMFIDSALDVLDLVALEASVIVRASVAMADLRTLNVELAEASRLASEATQAKSEFLASMSHELRTPLNAVLGFSEVLREQLEGKVTERQARYITNIRAAGEHLLELINDVLDLSKVEAGRLQLRPEPTSIRALIEPVVESAAQLALQSKVTFQAPDMLSGTILVDAGRVRQVLLNLLSNAFKFTPAPGRVSFAIAIDGLDLRFDVADTGIGIAADRQERVFGMFERLHEGRSDAAGTGLGLAITKKLVELHHGTIAFESHEGKGTRFWVVLEDVVIKASTGPRVLIIEDDPSDAELIAQLAREAGLRVEIAPTAASALSSIAQSAPSAVVLDLRLPDRRGDEVLRSLKCDPATAAIPVFVATVEDDDGKARLLGAADHMTKPIDRDRLRRWLAELPIGGGAVARSTR